MRYPAARTSLLHYAIGPPDALLGEIDLPDRPWPAEGAPMTPLLGAALTGFPVLTVGGIAYAAHRKLLTRRLLVNAYDVWLTGPQGEVLHAATPGGGRRWTIHHGGRTYAFSRTRLGGFGYRLEGADLNATFSDTTPFLTVSSRRAFACDADGAVDPLLLTFCLFLGTSISFR